MELKGEVIPDEHYVWPYQIWSQMLAGPAPIDQVITHL